MTVLGRAVSVVAPLLYVAWHLFTCTADWRSLMCSPVTSYADQIVAMHRSGSSAGFSLDIPLIMLTASLLKIFYWPGAQYDASLLVQAAAMVVVQLVLLKVALDNRPAWRGGADALPFAGVGHRAPLRPWGFWRWKGQRMYGAPPCAAGGC